jgi:asparagine synthase (glutamine-hydrolysing)
MSGFSAIFQRDGRPLDVPVLQRMNEAICHRGPDGSGSWVDGPVGLAHQVLHATPDTLRETRPAESARGTLVLVYEGLIDNGADIREAARTADFQVMDGTDATAILLAYELWRDECATHLSGDFAFAIWDRADRRCFCARDPIGIRPFYYHLDDRLFACGSELRQLLRHPGIRQDPNEGVAAEYLSNAVTTVDETLYREIQRLPAGHSLTVTASRHRVRRYWTFDPARRIQFRTDGEYAEALHGEIRTAVRACGRAQGPLGIELSGGLDSSSVAAVARDLVARGEVRAPTQTFSVAYPGLDCDEGDYVREADRMWGNCTRRVSFALPSKSSFEAVLAAHRDFPECPNGVAQRPLYKAVREHGCRVLLGGLGGDDCLTGHYVHYADLLKQMRLPTLHRQMRADGVNARALVNLAVRPLVPRTLRRVRRMLRRGYPDWISDRFAKSVALADRLRPPQPVRRQWQSLAQEQIFRDLTHGWTYYVHETLSRVLAEHGLELRSPLLRLNVVEFALAIPEEQRWRGAETKFVLRQSMKGLLPEKIRTRLNKADFGTLFPRMFSQLDSAPVFQSLRLVSRGWLDASHVGRMHARLAAWEPHASVSGVAIWPLWMIFGVESWLTKSCSHEGT